MRILTGKDMAIANAIKKAEAQSMIDKITDPKKLKAKAQVDKMKDMLHKELKNKYRI